MITQPSSILSRIKSPHSAVLIAIAVVGLFQPAAAVAEGDCTIAETAIQYAAKIRGLKNQKKVPCRLQDKAEVEKYLRTAIDEKAPADRMNQESWTYKLLGIIPWNYNYTEGLIKMYTEQLGGYYDSEKEYYAMADWMPEVMQMPIAVHELTHALQDQNFDLDKLIDEKRDSSDTMLSRSALVEGDATAVMMDYTKLLAGQKPLKDEQSVSSIMMQNIAGSMMTSSLQQAPSTLQTMMIFPYVSGLNFVHSLLKKGGYSEINSAYARTPHTTAEILHPDRYINGSLKFKTPVEVTDQLAMKGEKELYSDSLGEFVTSTWLSSWIGPVQASQTASGWAGDKLWLFEGEGGRKLLRWSTVWGDEAAALKFYQAVKAAMTKRTGAEPIDSGDSLSWSGKEPTLISVSRSGDGVMLSIQQ
jgi:hypothetical protein